MPCCSDIDRHFSTIQGIVDLKLIYLGFFILLGFVLNIVGVATPCFLVETNRATKKETCHWVNPFFSVSFFLENGVFLGQKLENSDDFNLILILYLRPNSKNSNFTVQSQLYYFQLGYSYDLAGFFLYATIVCQCIIVWLFGLIVYR